MDQQQNRYVIQKHTQDEGVHWDLMLEAGEILRTYRLDIGPEEILNRPATAEKIFDHSLRFLTYEGLVQNGTGTVKIEDRGIYKITSESNDLVEINFEGEVLSGNFKFKHVEKQCWLLTTQ
jgi:bifunctional non-homologous end joining protein LigD